MNRHNWITAYTSQSMRPSRFDPPERHWLDLHESLNRWGAGFSWSRYEQLGQNASSSSQNRATFTANDVRANRHSDALRRSLNGTALLKLLKV